jgi:molecular chaperone GrpE
MVKNSDLDFTSKDKINNIITDSPHDTVDKLIVEQDSTIESTSPQDIVIEANDTLNNAELKLEIKELEKKLIEASEKMYRIAADASNASKQNQIDIENAKKTAKKQLIKNLLPFLTTIVLSFDFTPNNEESLSFVNQLKSSLEKLNPSFEASNVQFIIPNKGDQFIPQNMQALNSSTEENPTVKNIASIGCIVDGQVIQPSSVII